MTLAASYALLILLPCILIALAGLLPRSVTLGTCLACAFGLLPTYYLDHLLLGGIGFHSLPIFGFLAVIVTAMLWPLPLLGATPTLWRSRQWRRAIFGYGVAFFVLVILAAWQMTRSWDERDAA